MSDASILSRKQNNSQVGNREGDVLCVRLMDAVTLQCARCETGRQCDGPVVYGGNILNSFCLVGKKLVIFPCRRTRVCVFVCACVRVCVQCIGVFPAKCVYLLKMWRRDEKT